MKHWPRGAIQRKRRHPQITRIQTKTACGRFGSTLRGLNLRNLRNLWIGTLSSLKLFLENLKLLSQHSHLGFQCFHFSFECSHPIIGPAPASGRRNFVLNRVD